MPRPVSQGQQTRQLNNTVENTTSRPPEYTAVATTEFIVDNTLPEADNEEIRETTSDTEPLVSPPPPYTP